jgi:hypothetical protein
MHRYLSSLPKREYPPEVRLVHNFYPGPLDDPGRDRPLREGGFRVWITDEPPEADLRSSSPTCSTQATATSTAATAAGSTAASTTGPLPT